MKTKIQDTLNKIQDRKEQIAFEAGNLDYELDNDLCPLTSFDEHGNIIHTPVVETPQIKQLRRSISGLNHARLSLNRQKKIILAPAPISAVVHAAPRTPRARHGEGSRSSAASGDGNSDSAEPDPDPERSPLQLFDASSLADLFCISKKTIQNQYSRTPWLLPPAICIPGARGPRWTASAVQAWLENRPQHSAKPAPQPAKNKVGRPRIAPVKQGGAS